MLIELDLSMQPLEIFRGSAIAVVPCAFAAVPSVTKGPMQTYVFFIEMALTKRIDSSSYDISDEHHP